MAMLERLLGFLDENGVEYLHTAHATAHRAREAACAERILNYYFAKTVVFHSDDGYVMAVLPADQALDLKLLQASLGLRHARLATESELEEIFPDCELGAMPPFGNLFALPVYMESGMAADAMIAFKAGTHRDVVDMRFQDYEALVKPVFKSLAKPLAASA
jgi:Ala-tRNA(Pro) deacylase